MLKRLRQLFARTALQDPVFGLLRYQRKAQFWEGAVIFAPTGRSVEVLLDAPISGPSDSQRAFLRELEARYPSILKSLSPALEVASQGAVSQNARVQRHDAFTLRSIELPELAATRSSFTLTFEGTSQGTHFVVPIHSWQPGSVVVETC